MSYEPLPFRDDSGKFLPGQPYSGQRKQLEGTLRRVVAQDKGNRLRAACERILDIAANDPEPRNSMAAFTIIADRLDGKAVARIETSEGAPRDLGLAEIVALVLQHRKAEAIDAPSQHTGGGMGEGDIPMDQAEGVGG
jgi:hypothetical protein